MHKLEQEGPGLIEQTNRKQDTLNSLPAPRLMSSVALAKSFTAVPPCVT